LVSSLMIPLSTNGLIASNMDHTPVIFLSL